MYRAFLLNFDSARMVDLLPQLYAFVQSNALTYQFYSPFYGMIFIKSACQITDLIESYNAFFAGQPFMIAEVDPVKTGGRLPQDVWDWLNNPAPPPLPYIPLGPA